MDGASDTCVDDELGQRERGAKRVGAEGEARGRGEEAVHDIVGVGGETDEEKELRVVLNSAHNAFNRDRAR